MGEEKPELWARGPRQLEGDAGAQPHSLVEESEGLKTASSRGLKPPEASLPQPWPPT